MSNQSKGWVEYFWTAFSLAITAFTIWGIIWSFKRHGTIHGVASIAFFPYGTYRGVASIWEKPEWKERYDREVANITMIALSDLSKDPAKIVEFSEMKAGRKRFVESLPEKERAALRESFRGLMDAFGPFQFVAFCKMVGFADSASVLMPLLESAEERFADNASIAAVWADYKRNNDKALAAIFAANPDARKLLNDEVQFEKIGTISTIAAEKAYEEMAKALEEMGVVLSSDVRPFDRSPWMQFSGGPAGIKTGWSKGGL